MPKWSDLEVVYKHHQIPKKYEGPIYTLDLDKTYLATEFESFRKLLKIPFEKASEKKNIPASEILLQNIQKQTKSPIFFITGSPRAMGSVFEEKFFLDKIHVNGIIMQDFKDAFKKLDLKKIVNKIGHKLTALIYGRCFYPIKAYEILLGDDSEYDSIIYSLYTDYINGNLDSYEVLTILKKWNIPQSEFDLVKQSMELLENKHPKRNFKVKYIFTHLEVKTSPNEWTNLHPCVKPTYNYFQVALILYADKIINLEALNNMVKHLVEKYNYKYDFFLSSIEDLITRGLLNKKVIKKNFKSFLKSNADYFKLKILDQIKIEISKIVKTFSKVPKELLTSKKSIQYDNKLLFYLNYTPYRQKL